MNEKFTLPDEDTCWQALEDHDPRYNGLIFYGVRSTGVYCRPTCPARRPHRSNVTYFASCDEAEAAGFRACLRCKPRQQGDPALELAQRARQALDEAAGEPLTLQTMGEKLGVSPYHLQRTFKAATGLTPHQYAAALRAEQFKTQARAGQDVSSAGYEAGYGSSSRLYADAPGALGMTPARYRSGGKGMTLYTLLFPTPLGRMLIAARELVQDNHHGAAAAYGICAVRMGDSDEELLAALEDEFPAARRAPVESAPPELAAHLNTWAEAFCSYLNGARPDLDLPLAVMGTAFQQRVWAELRRIPYGQTRTYTQVAQAIGQVNAVRAVARACATNPTALVVPCHRVIRGDGSLAGYRWGLSRKQALLELEKRS